MTRIKKIKIKTDNISLHYLTTTALATAGLLLLTMAYSPVAYSQDGDEKKKDVEALAATEGKVPRANKEPQGMKSKGESAVERAGMEASKAKPGPKDEEKIMKKDMRDEEKLIKKDKAEEKAMKKEDKAEEKAMKKEEKAEEKVIKKELKAEEKDKAIAKADTKAAETKAAREEVKSTEATKSAMDKTESVEPIKGKDTVKGTEETKPVVAGKETTVKTEGRIKIKEEIKGPIAAGDLVAGTIVTPQEVLRIDIRDRFVKARETGALFLVANEIDTNRIRDLRTIVNLDLTIVNVNNVTLERLIVLDNLTTLRIVGGSLTVLPDKVLTMRGLHTLDLTGLGLRELSPRIGNLTNLRVLILDGNRLRTLPPEIGYLSKLRVLSVVDNQFKSSQFGSLWQSRP